MAQHRTKRDKISAQLRREEQFQYNLADLSATSTKESLKEVSDKTTPHRVDRKKSELANQVDPKFVTKDLIRSLISTALIFAVLLGLWWGLR